ncbi:20707_t:CDS:2, partial [Funneliformis geosporum]
MPGLFLGNDRESPTTYPRLLRSGLNNVSMDSAHSVLPKASSSLGTNTRQHDPDGHEVVPQSQLIISRQAFRNNGEIESISQMKPKAPNKHEDGLLEDIIGTSKYKIPLEEANEKHELLDEE